MTGLERIKEQELKQEGDHCYASITIEYDCGQCGYNGMFLLKAFQVMREMALHIEEDYRLARTNYSLGAKQAEHCVKSLEKEFEERMTNEGN